MPKPEKYFILGVVRVQPGEKSFFFLLAENRSAPIAVKPLRSARSYAPRLLRIRFDPSGDCVQCSAKKTAQEEESKRKLPVNLSDNVDNHMGSYTRTLSRRRSPAAS
jgi:hypothetical protein